MVVPAFWRHALLLGQSSKHFTRLDWLCPHQNHHKVGPWLLIVSTLCTGVEEAERRRGHTASARAPGFAPVTPTCLLQCGPAQAGTWDLLCPRSWGGVIARPAGREAGRLWSSGFCRRPQTPKRQPHGPHFVTLYPCKCEGGTYLQLEWGGRTSSKHQESASVSGIVSKQ